MDHIAKRPVIGILTGLGVVLLLGSFSVRGDEAVGSIQGTVFIDENGNGIYDAGEPLMPGIQVELANGEVILDVMTNEEGAFTVEVGLGLWRSILHPPEGYMVINDPTREVVIGAEGSYEAIMDFALIPLPSPLDIEPANNQQEGNAGEEAFQQESEAPEEMNESQENPSSIERYTDEVASALGGQQADYSGMILPESGSSFPIVLGVGLLLLLILLVGIAFIFVGRGLTR
jgi:hypothetical protein